MPPDTPQRTPRVGLVMPTFRQEPFISRAIASVLMQTFTDWELIVVDDGSPDRTCDAVAPFLADERIHYVRLGQNTGLGHALNVGCDLLGSEMIGYLPSDDVFHADHLATLVAELDETDAVLAYAGIRHATTRSSTGCIEGEALQLVQVLHRPTGDRWVERDEVTTDDLDRMRWNALRTHGTFVGTGHVTCEWVDHPGQRHKRIRESSFSGLNAYRSYHAVQQPMRFHSSIGNDIDEEAHYRRFRERPTPKRSTDGLTILLVGELAFNPERVLALEERGHRLFGLWTPTPADFTAVGPMPFGGVEDIPREGWQDAVRRLKPDIIYGLLNWHAVPFVHHVLVENPGVPFVWHFKEGPFFCVENGTWPMLVDLHSRADGRIYASPELRDWFDVALPGAAGRPTIALDGDLPKQDWFDGEFSCRLSELDGEIHTLLPGRPIGLEPETVGEMARQGIHLHFYGEVFHRRWSGWIDEAQRLAPRHLHLHPQSDQDSWVSEFSKYDAGWLHTFASDNQGDLHRASWDDLNYPARLATLAAAGIPMIQRDNAGSTVATQTLARELDIGLFFEDLHNLDDLAVHLRDEDRMSALRKNVLVHRPRFTFDEHADHLIDFFRQVIDASSATLT